MTFAVFGRVSPFVCCRVETFRKHSWRGEVARDPKVLIAASPTRGLDVGATEAVRNLLLAQRDSGVGVLMISEDLDEVMALSDRILVMFDGRVVGEVSGDDAAVEQIGMMMGGTVAEATA